MTELTAIVVIKSLLRATTDDATPIIRRLARNQARAFLDSRAGDAGEGVPTINDDQVYRLRKVAEAECGCRIPAPFDEVADHVAKVAFDEAVKRCRPATPAPADDAVPAGEVEFNGSIGQAQRALRFLAENDRPIGGEEFANAASLEQIADDLEVTRKRLASLSHGEGRK